MRRQKTKWPMTTNSQESIESGGPQCSPPTAEQLLNLFRSAPWRVQVHFCQTVYDDPNSPFGGMRKETERSLQRLLEEVMKTSHMLPQTVANFMKLKKQVMEM